MFHVIAQSISNTSDSRAFLVGPKCILEVNEMLSDVTSTGASGAFDRMKEKARLQQFLWTGISSPRMEPQFLFLRF